MPTFTGWITIIVILGMMGLIIAAFTELGVMWDWRTRIHEMDPTYRIRPWIPRWLWWVLILGFLAANLLYTGITGHRG